VHERWRIRKPCVDENAKVRLGRLAARQFGRVRHDQIPASRTTIANWTADGYLHRELPSVYAVGHAARSPESDLAAAVLYAGPSAVLSHGTAAHWWGLVNYPPQTIHVSTPRRRKSRPGIQVHARRTLERVDHNGIPVTMIAQTLLDFAAGRPKRELLRFALANADYHGLLDVAAIEAVCGPGAPGSAALRAALDVHLPELAHTRSELERRLVGICETYRLPMPTFNVYRRGWLVDAVWEHQRLVVELDGHRGHRTRSQLESDHRRDLELRAAGYVVLRYTWRQLTRTPAAVASDIGRYL
jgi:very-short-patch-repair endonuclease